MSDNDDDAEFEASLANLEVSGFEGGGGTLPGTADPEIASRLDGLHSAMSTLGMRLDSLVTSTTTYRSSLTDRLTEYADLVTKLTRTQSNDLEEYRRANERTIADLRRSLSSSEEVLERVGARIDSMLTEAETSDDSSRRMLAEVRSILDAQESLGRFITESLDTFADRVTERIDTGQQASVTQLDALRSTLDELRTDGSGGRIAAVDAKLDSLLDGAEADSATLATAVDQLRETLLDVASGQVVGALWDEVRGIRDTIDQLAAGTSDDGSAATIEAVRTEIASVRAALADAVATEQPDPASAAAVEAVRAEIASVRETLAEALAAGEPEAEAAPDPQLGALHDDVAALTDAVRSLLDQAEVVDDSVPSADAGMLTAVAADVSHLRAELAQGLVVEPSDALASAVDELRSDLAELRDRLTVLAELETKLDELRVAADTDDDAWADGPAADADPAEPDDTAADATAERIDVLAAEIANVRAGVDDIIARLDEGIVLADDELTPPASSPTAASADQLAALRDQVVTEFDALREAIGRAAPAGSSDGDGDGDGGLDPDTVDLLREEIRAVAAQVADTVADAVQASPGASEGASAGASDGDSDEVFAALTKELKALRRRIKLRAEGEVFSAADLDAIAAALAERLAD